MAVLKYVEGNDYSAAKFSTKRQRNDIMYQTVTKSVFVQPIQTCGSRQPESCVASAEFSYLSEVVTSFCSIADVGIVPCKVDFKI